MRTSSSQRVVSLWHIQNPGSWLKMQWSVNGCVFEANNYDVPNAAGRVDVRCRPDDDGISPCPQKRKHICPA